MKVDCDWNGKQNFVANINGFKVHMDAAKPFGDESAPTPKQLALAIRTKLRKQSIFHRRSTVPSAR